MNTTRAARRASLIAAGAIDNPTTEVTYFEGELADEYKPEVPKRVRDIAYFTGLGVSALTLLAVGIVTIWAPDYASQAAQTGVIVSTTTGIVVGGLGVVYRPGAQG
jgi:hypothetical protein